MDLVDISELAKKLGVRKSWIYSRTRLKGDDQIPCLRIGKYLRFEFNNVMQWLKTQNENRE